MGALDFVDQRFRAALPEFVSLVNRRHAEVARVRTAAARFDDPVALVDERRGVSIERDEIPGGIWHRGETSEGAVRKMRPHSTGCITPCDARHVGGAIDRSDLS